MWYRGREGLQRVPIVATDDDRATADLSGVAGAYLGMFGGADRHALQRVARACGAGLRLNVALSRARTKAVLLAPAALLDTMPDDYAALLAIEDWRRILDAAHRIPLAAITAGQPVEAPR